MIITIYNYVDLNALSSLSILCQYANFGFVRLCYIEKVTGSHSTPTQKFGRFKWTKKITSFNFFFFIVLTSCRYNEE